MILTQVWIKPLCGPSEVRIIKTNGNIGIYCPRIFHMRPGTNKLYYLEYDWERLSPYSIGKVK